MRSGDERAKRAHAGRASASESDGDGVRGAAARGSMSEALERVDTIVDGWYVVTMNPSRDIIHYGSVALRDGVIVAVGPTAEIGTRYVADRRLGGERFVVTPGLVNTHIHITGEPLTRGYVPDDTPFEENVFGWLCPLYAAHGRGGRADVRAAGRRRRCCAPARRRSWRPGRSGSSTRCSRAWASDRHPRPVVGAGCGICRPIPTSTGSAPTRRSVTSKRQLESYRSVADGRLGAWCDRDRPHDVQRPAVAGGPASWPTTTASG